MAGYPSESNGCLFSSEEFRVVMVYIAVGFAFLFGIAVGALAQSFFGRRITK